jgi:hypothetical protein
MRSFNRIFEKAVLPFALAAVVGGASAFLTINSSAATCSGGDGSTCTGECCSGGPGGCAAGPCPKPAPQQPPRPEIAD